VSGFSFEKLCPEIAFGCLGGSSLSGLTVLESGMRGEESLVVGWAALGFFALGRIERRSVSGSHRVSEVSEAGCRVLW
jgi:hypothetical protein